HAGEDLKRQEIFHLKLRVDDVRLDSRNLDQVVVKRKVQAQEKSKTRNQGQSRTRARALLCSLSVLRSHGHRRHPERLDADSDWNEAHSAGLFPRCLADPGPLCSRTVQRAFCARDARFPYHYGHRLGTSYGLRIFLGSFLCLSCSMGGFPEQTTRHQQFPHSL
ncbi:hypothetical protein K438DRAFT_2169974, partial [Mycena galopus ATCC 62051]